MNFFLDMQLWIVMVVLIIELIVLAVFYWMGNKQRERRVYYTDRFEYILKELLERVRKAGQTVKP